MKRIAAIKAYFGLLPGQSIAEFAKEVQALSDSDRDELGAACCKALGVELIRE